MLDKPTEAGEELGERSKLLLLAGLGEETSLAGEFIALSPSEVSPFGTVRGPELASGELSPDGPDGALRLLSSRALSSPPGENPPA